MENYLKQLLFVALFGILGSCVKQEKPETESAISEFCIPDSLMKNITLDTVQTGSVMSELKLSGKISFNEDHVVKVYPVVSGHVADVKVTLGDHVEKGQVLAVVQSLDMANYNNELKTAQSELAIAKKNLDVINEMKSSGVSSEKDYLNAQSEYQKAQAALNKVKEVMKIYGNPGKTYDSISTGYTVIAPISGFIVEKNVNAGQELRGDNSNYLFTITDLKEVWAIANVYETDIAKIKTGSDALITTLSYPDKPFEGKVEKISNILNPETNAMTLKIKLSNADYSLKPGMFANISILFPDKEKMMVLPSRAILFEDNKNYVVEFRKRCDLNLKEVKVIKSFRDMSYIQSDGLNSGDLVVNANNLFVFTALRKR